MERTDEAVLPCQNRTDCSGGSTDERKQSCDT